MTEIRSFVTWEIPTLEQIQDCKAVALRRGIDNGYKLTREDKDWITANVNGNSYFKNAIPTMGYKVPFADVLRRYWVRQYGSIHEYYDTDKTALRNYLCGKIDEIADAPPAMLMRLMRVLTATLTTHSAAWGR